MMCILKNLKITLILLTISAIFMLFAGLNYSNISMKHIRIHLGNSTLTFDETGKWQDISFTQSSVHSTPTSGTSFSREWKSKASTLSGGYKQRAKDILQNKNSSSHTLLPKGLLTICSPNNTREIHELVLLTSMYHAEVKRPIFETVIKMWSLLLPEVLPVLYINNLHFATHWEPLLNMACSKGWAVAVAPKSLQSGFPLVSSMFQYSIQNFPASWYGLSNGDILHTDRMWRILKQVREMSSPSPSLPGISFVTSRKYKGLVNTSDEISTIQDIHDKSQSATLRGPHAIDLFIYRNGSALLNNMPAFAMGRRGYDNWLVYQAVTSKSTGALDISTATPSLHLGAKGLSDSQNSHRSRHKDANYNVNMPVVKKSKNYYSLGQIDCIAFHAVEKPTANKEFTIEIKQRKVPSRCHYR